MTTQSTAKRVLIVDDEVEICSILKEFFESEGYVAAIANNGLEGLEQATVFQPDIIVMDVRMPEQDGITTLKELKNISLAPVIICSGLANRETAEKCLNLGAADFIAKPIDLEELQTVVKKHLKAGDAG